ncbi:MAG: M18 family aminopeptidase [Deltaproteobacteria bacterium]|nr:M18 family aminopeptidase [Deltaproteobacteria bacterium]
MAYSPATISDPRTRADARTLADDLLAFLNASPVNAFAVAEMEHTLREVGFTELSEARPFELRHGLPYYVKRHDTALIAFVVGDLSPAEAGFRIVGAHTDSPGFKIKPNPERVSQGLVHLGVEVYGGPLIATWTDRDLGLAGRVFLLGEDGRVETRLYRSSHGLLSLPNLAIHQNREANDGGLKLNPQTELRVVLGSVSDGLPEEGALRWLLAQALDVDTERILDYDLFLYDTQAPSYSGVSQEFIHSGRLDDLAMCHAAVTALAETAAANSSWTRVVACFDAEEVGSRTPQGAQSWFLPSVLERIGASLGDDREGHYRALAQSSLVSADNAHGIHPGYPGKAEPDHAPVLNGGPVIKSHAGGAYATDGYGAALFERAAKRVSVPVQRFVNRSDVRSGGTIGSMVATQLGILAVDVGNPQYAMHSVREMAGTWDHWYMTRTLQSFMTR